jgi:hypothetical protein
MNSNYFEEVDTGYGVSKLLSTEGLFIKGVRQHTRSVRLAARPN